jgi:hypothetical protein
MKFLITQFSSDILYVLSPGFYLLTLISNSLIYSLPLCLSIHFIANKWKLCCLCQQMYPVAIGGITHLAYLLKQLNVSWHNTPVGANSSYAKRPWPQQDISLRLSSTRAGDTNWTTHLRSRWNTHHLRACLYAAFQIVRTTDGVFRCDLDSDFE